MDASADLEPPPPAPAVPPPPPAPPPVARPAAGRRRAWAAGGGRGRLVLLFAILAVAILAVHATGLSHYLHPRAMVGLLRGLRGSRFAEAIFVLGHAAAVLVVPSTLLTIAGGVLFGFRAGAALNWLGAMLGALGAYALARGLGSEAVNRWLGRHPSRLGRLASAHGFRTILSLRLLPMMPFTVVSVAAGLAKVRMRDYLLATAIGYLPMDILFTYFAGALSFGGRATRAAVYWRVGTLCALLLLLSLLPAITSALARRSRSLPAFRALRALARGRHLWLALVVGAAALEPAASQVPRALMPIEFANSAEFGWLGKSVHERRALDSMADSTSWRLTGTGRLTFPAEPRLAGMRVLRVDMQMFSSAPAPTRNRLSAVNLRRPFAGEDWRAYNRLSMWIRPEVAGFPMLPLQIVLHNDGAEKVPDRYGREGIHYATLANGGWQQVVWEIEPLARDRVTMIEIGYFVNKMLAAPGDRVAFEVGRLELQRVDPDHYTGWSVAPGRIAFSHTGYQTGHSKTAVTSGVAASDFELLRVNDNALGAVVLHRPVQTVRTRLGEFGQMDFSEVEAPGTYILRSGDTRTRPFRIGPDVWTGTIWKALNFFYGNRCGYDVPGSHGVDHLDWFAAQGDQRITMSGGWHDAGDLSQGVINTGEATYAMFALAERLRARGDDPALVARLIEEAKWGLDWVMRVRFPGGYRVAFASHNLWTNNVVGDADDRTVVAKNNPNANYIAAAALGLAARVLKETEPELAARSLALAEDDWTHAIAGVDGPATWHTPAFAATRLELAGIGITASLELYRATGSQRYADKAVELARVIVASQQKRRVGSAFPLAGFFYTGPERDTLFHQFHRGNDQAPIVALTQLVEALPDHADWMRWYSTVALYAEYQKRSATTTAPYGVLPSYVYRADDAAKEVPDSGALHLATRDAYRAQVLAGLALGDGWYLRAFPVWFARRGNFGVLLSQAKALATAGRLRGDSAALDLAQRQAQWIVGRNPFVQSTMYGEGYDWAQQYSVSSGDFVGSLPVGMQSRGVTDLPYWPSQNTYVYKEVWVHPVSRWLWLMADLIGGASPDSATRHPAATATATTAPGGEVTIRLTASGEGTHTFALRTDNLVMRGGGTPASRVVTLRPGRPVTVEWKTRPTSAAMPWVAVVVPDRDFSRRREVTR